MTNETFELHFDGGHEWLRVPKSIALGFTPTAYSYHDETYWYLEGDCDGSEFAQVYEGEHGRKLQWIGVDDGYDSFIRDLPHVG